MPTYLTPGVYFEELSAPEGPWPTRYVPRPSPELDAVPKPRWLDVSAPAAFIGHAEEGPLDEPVYVSRWEGFAMQFGPEAGSGHLHDAVRGFFANGGQGCYVLRVEPEPHAFVEGTGPSALGRLPN